MNMLHPVKPLGGLYLHCRRKRLGMVKRSRLHVDHSWQRSCIPMEQPAAAISTETAHGGA